MKNKKKIDLVILAGGFGTRIKKYLKGKPKPMIKFDKFNFFGYADFNKKRIYRKVSLSDGVISIQDFSNDVELGKYASWGEEKNGIKVEFSEGYKRFI